MDNNCIYITINHLDDYNGLSNIKVGDDLILRKDEDNLYDDEAIAVYNKDEIKIGYVANSTDTVARGTYSAGRIYDSLRQDQTCRICFIINEVLIGQLS